MKFNNSKKQIKFWNMRKETASLELCAEQSDFIQFLSGLKDSLYAFFCEPSCSVSVLEKSLDFLTKNFQDSNLDLKRLASANNISPNHLCKIFNKELATSPIQYLTKIRISSAKHYLKTTDKQIKEIANLVGFNNSYYFSRTFKKSAGITPKEFRDK